MVIMVMVRMTMTMVTMVMTIMVMVIMVTLAILIGVTPLCSRSQVGGGTLVKVGVAKEAREARQATVSLIRINL